MLHLDEHLRYLISRHDCVVVPGWGAFITQSIPAHYDSTSSSFEPPRREVLFNPGLTHNDGLLAASIARRQQISYDRALDSIRLAVESMHHQLVGEGELAISRIGSFKYAGHGLSPIFEPSNTSSANAPFAFMPKIENLDATQTECDGSTVSHDVLKKHSVIPTFIRVAAAVAIFLALGFTLTIPVENITENTDYASVVVGNHSKSTKVVTDNRLSSNELIISTPEKGDSQTSVDTLATNRYRKMVAKLDRLKEKRSATRIRKVANNTDERVIAEPVSNNYIIVVASFDSTHKAKKFIAMSGDSTLKISATGGHFRIYSDSADTEIEANRLRAGAEKRYKGAWVCEQ